MWPVLSAERGEQEMVTGNRTYAGQLLASIDNMSAGVGLVPEQDWDTTDLAASALRYRSDYGIHRFRQRQAGRLGRPADLGQRVAGAARRGPERPQGAGAAEADR